MSRSRSRVLGVSAVVGLLAAMMVAVWGSATAAPPVDLQPEVRFATFNASLNRGSEGQLITDLAQPYDPAEPDAALALRRSQAANVAEVIQRVRPDVLLINEFDFDAAGQALTNFQDNYLSIGRNGADPIEYPYTFNAPSNTGIQSGFDLNNDGAVGGPDDAWGFGFYPGQFGMVVLSMHPIDVDAARTFQHFKWKDMPGNLIPPGWYDDDELAGFPLSSKSHWDVPIDTGRTTVHFLVSHPTPPVFDGPEDRNGRRNHDEIRFWADFVDPAKSGYIYDDDGNFGGLHGGARFVIAGDQNSDPFDGDSIPGSAQLLLEHQKIRAVAPTSAGAAEASALQGGANTTHVGDPAQDTADFSDTAPGNLRVDYVLPSRQLKVLDTGVFWPVQSDPLFRLTGVFDPAIGGFPTSDHRLVWLDVRVH